MSQDEKAARKDPLSRWLTDHPVLTVALFAALIAIGLFFRWLRWD